jgi:HEAT repeat protein/ATP/ADP translocase
MFRRMLQRRFGVPPEKLGRLAHFLALAVTLLTANVLAITLSEALFLSNAGAEQLPYFYLLVAAFSVPVAAVFSQLVDRVARPRLFRWLLGLAALTAVGLWALVGLDMLPAFYAVYIGFSLLEMLVDIQFWVLVSDYFTSLELKHFAAFLVMAMALGGLVGGGAANILSDYFLPATLILVLPGLFLLALVQVSWLERRQRPLEQAEPDEETESGLVESLKSFPPLMRRYPIILLLAMNALLIVIIRCVAEYQVFSIFEEAYPDEQDLTGFLGLLGAVLSVAEFAVIFFITRPLIQRLGVSRMNLIYPATTLASFAGLAASFRLPTAIAANVNYETLGNSVASPVENLNYNAVPRRFLGRVRVISDGLFLPGGTALAGVVLLLAGTHLTSAQITYVGLGLSVVLLMVGWRVGKGYLSSLVELLRARSVNLDEVSEGLARLPAKYADEVRALLRSDDRNAQVLGVELAARMDPAAFLPELEALLPVADAAVRRALVRLYAAFRPGQLTRQMRALLDSENETQREMALEALIAAREPLEEGVLARLLDDASPVVRGQAAVSALLVRGAGRAPAALLAEAARGVAGSELPDATHLAMIQAVRSLAAADASAAEDPEAVRLLRLLLERAGPTVKDDALEALAGLARRAREQVKSAGAGAAARELAEIAEGFLAHDEAPVRAGAVNLLAATGAAEALPRLAAMLEDANQAVRENAAAALGAAGDASLERVKPYLASPRVEVAEAAITAAGAIRSRRAEDLLFDHMQPGYELVRRSLAWLPRLPQTPQWMPLRTALEDANQRVTRRVLHVLGALGHARTLNCVRRILHGTDARVRADAVETLASLSHRRFVEPILPLLESAGAAASEGGAPEGLLAEALESTDRWVVVGALAAAAAGNAPLPEDVLREHPDPLVRSSVLHTVLERSARAAGAIAESIEATGLWQRSQYMNRVLFLKNIPLFAGLSLDDLLILDGALVQKEYLAGETIFAEGHLGSDLCILSRGAVAIRKTIGGAERDLAQLAPGECFGEMALFDDAPRSATAVATGDATLLTLERSRFLTLIAQRPEIAVEVCKVLSLRLREANERLGRATAGAELA